MYKSRGSNQRYKILKSLESCDYLINSLPFLFFTVCSCESTTPIQNPFLPKASFNVQIDLNLPLYSPLQNTGNSITLPNNLGELREFISLMLDFQPFELSRFHVPIIIPSSCSSTEFQGSQVNCQCEDQFSYSVFTGQLLNRQGSETLFDLTEYQVRTEGTMLYIFN